MRSWEKHYLRRYRYSLAHCCWPRQSRGSDHFQMRYHLLNDSRYTDALGTYLHVWELSCKDFAWLTGDLSVNKMFENLNTTILWCDTHSDRHTHRPMYWAALYATKKERKQTGRKRLGPRWAGGPFCWLSCEGCRCCWPRLGSWGCLPGGRLSWWDSSQSSYRRFQWSGFRHPRPGRGRPVQHEPRLTCRSILQIGSKVSYI